MIKEQGLMGRREQEQFERGRTGTKKNCKGKITRTRTKTRRSEKREALQGKGR